MQNIKKIINTEVTRSAGTKLSKGAKKPTVKPEAQLNNIIFDPDGNPVEIKNIAHANQLGIEHTHLSKKYRHETDAVLGIRNDNDRRDYILFFALQSIDRALNKSLECEYLRKVQEIEFLSTFHSFSINKKNIYAQFETVNPETN